MKNVRFYIFVTFLFVTNHILATTILINNNWTITPKGGNPVNANMPCFYGWDSSLDIFIEAGVDEDRWKLFDGVEEAEYKKVLTLPSYDSDERLFVHFKGVNFLAKIYINDQLVKTHMEGFLPFEADITDFVSGNGTDTLKVKIIFWDSRFLQYSYIDDPNAKAYTPRGRFSENWQLGIVGDVSLIVRPETFVEDIYVKTSTRNSQASAVVNVANHGSITKTVKAIAEIQHNGASVYVIGLQTFNVASGDSASCTISGPFIGATRWSPENPYMYEMVVRLYQGETLLHTKVQKFGFREFWINGTHFMLNGSKRNLRGGNIVIDSEDTMYEFLYPDSLTWASTVDSMLALNFNVLRFHQAPPPEWMINVCDVKGMLVVAESAIYGDPPYRNDTFVTNSAKWIKDWVKRERSHPSIIMWSAMNEMICIYGKLTYSQILTLWDALEEADDTRPYFNDGDFDVDNNGTIYSYHYPWGWLFPGYQANKLYDMDEYIHDTKPTSWGEFAWSRGTETGFSRQDWIKTQGIKTRASRVLEIADIRPYRLDWAWHSNSNFSQGLYDFTPTREEVEFIKNSMSPVAGFDKDYYVSNYDPTLPSANENEYITRNYIFFNDETSGTALDVFWCSEYDGLYQDTSSTSIVVSVGSYTEQNIQFRAPIVRETGTFNLHVWIEKSGVRKFYEVVRYKSVNNGLSYPAAATNIQFQEEGQDLQVSWDPVTLNDEGNSTTISHYAVYRSPNPNFPGLETDIYSPITTASYLDTNFDTSNDTTVQYFYKIKTVDDMGWSSMSDISGKFDYHFVTTSKTDFNCVAIPFMLSDGYTNASDYIDFFPSCNSIAQWLPDEQGIQQYWVENGNSDFEMTPGYPYFVNCTKDTFFTFSGIPVTSNFNLVTSSPTSWNMIMLPFDKYELEDASDLYQDITDCNGIALWSNYSQSFVKQYSPSVPQQNFDVVPGYAYWVHVSDNVSWPNESMQKISIKDSTVHQIKRVKVPHLIYGQINNSYIASFVLTLHNTQECLTDQSPGCFLNKDSWGVQCGNFASGWQPGDTVSITFFNNKSHKLITMTHVLSQGAFENMQTTSVESNVSLPNQFTLLNSYPNPFNGELTIQFELQKTSEIKINIFNSRGQLVDKLIDRSFESGKHTIKWNTRNQNTINLPSGVYIIQLVNQQRVQVNKVLLMK